MATMSVRERRARRYRLRERLREVSEGKTVIKLTPKAKQLLIERFGRLKGVPRPNAASEISEHFVGGTSYAFRTHLLLQLLDEPAGSESTDELFEEDGIFADLEDELCLA